MAFGMLKFYYLFKSSPSPSGVIAGGTGAVVGTPAEISLIRMTADGRLPPEQRRGYKNVFNALFRITREEGVMTLWRVRHCLSVCMHACVIWMRCVYTCNY